jgi:hypothetical protein
MENETLTATAKLSAAINALGLTIESKFVPFSLSRNNGEKHSTLNWEITLKRAGRAILTTDYGAGQAHCPAYVKGVLYWEGAYEMRTAIAMECEQGKEAKKAFSGGRPYIAPGSKPIQPDAVGVIWALSRDADVMNYSDFESWAAEFGYETDSRKAESIYRACLETALKLRGAIGEAGIEALHTAGEDY